MFVSDLNSQNPQKLLICNQPTRFSQVIEDSPHHSVRRRVIDDESQEVYGALTNDTELDIRMKCLAAAIMSPLVVGLRMCYRVFLIFQGNSFVHVYQAAERGWNEKRYDAVFRSSFDQAPTEDDLFKDVVQQQLISLIKDIVKIVTYPLAWIALEFSALLGLVFPMHGRLFFTSIEQFYSTEYLPDQSCLPAGEKMRVCNYMAPCFLPLSIWQQKHLFSLYPRFDSRMIKSVFLEAKNYYEVNAAFLSPIIGQKLQQCQRFIGKRISNRVDRSYLWGVDRSQVERMQSYGEYHFLHRILDGLPDALERTVENRIQYVNQVLSGEEEFADRAFSEMADAENSLQSFLSANFEIPALSS